MHALHHRVPLLQRFGKRVADVLRLSHPRVLEHDAVVRHPVLVGQSEDLLEREEELVLDGAACVQETWGAVLCRVNA